MDLSLSPEVTTRDWGESRGRGGGKAKGGRLRGISGGGAFPWPRKLVLLTGGGRSVDPEECGSPTGVNALLGPPPRRTDRGVCILLSTNCSGSRGGGEALRASLSALGVPPLPAPPLPHPLLPHPLPPLPAKPLMPPPPPPPCPPLRARFRAIEMSVDTPVISGFSDDPRVRDDEALAW